MKRIFLFLLTNIAVLLVLSVVCSVFGLNRYLGERGLNPLLLLGFAAVFGMGGAFISLLLSKSVARMSTGGQLLTQPGSAAEAWLLATVEREARAAGIGIPEVLVYDAAEPNAFATGASRNHALVAVSTGLLRSMNQDEIEAVLGHEISHVANGDMVTLTLLQGVLNTFVLFLAQVAGYLVDNALRRGEDEGRYRGPGIGYYVVSMLLQAVLGVLATLIVCAFSRWREFHADAGGAHLAGKRKMVAALQKLQSLHEPSTLPQNLTAFGIAAGAARNLFATHPPLEQRIARLQEAK
jgi:heat shock protein HtpX